MQQRAGLLRRSSGSAGAFVLLSLPMLGGWMHAPDFAASRAPAFVVPDTVPLTYAGAAILLVLLAVGIYAKAAIGLAPLTVSVSRLRGVVSKVEPARAAEMLDMVLAFGKQATSPLGVHFTLVDPLCGDEDPAKYMMDTSLKTLKICFPPADVEQYAKTFDIADIKLVDKFVPRTTTKKSDCMVTMDTGSRSIVLRLASKTDADNFIKCVTILQKYNVE